MKRLAIMVLVTAAFIVTAALAQDPPVTYTPVPTTTAVAPAPSPASGWKQEPTGFAGVEFGTSPEETIARLKMSCKDLDKTNECTNDKYYILTGLDVSGEYYPNEEFYVTARFFFVKGNQHREFNGVELSCSNRTFSTLEALLFSKYGQPLATGFSTRNWDEGKTYSWVGENVNMTIFEKQGSMDTVHIERLTEAQRLAKTHL
jgi:hypothetical protein